MCGRTALSIGTEQLRCACGYKDAKTNKFTKPEYLQEHNNGKQYTPSYNIAPTDVTPVLISSAKFKNSAKTDRILKPMMWGIIPPWHKGDYKNHNLSTNNCRIENIRDSKLYSPILNSGGRCIIVAEGFYEWQTTVKSKTKQPYYIFMKQDSEITDSDPDCWLKYFSEEEGWKGKKLLFMAGLYHIWQDNNVVIYSYSVITMESNETLGWLHHRMPAILHSEEQVEAWLDIENVNVDMAIHYLKPIKILEWYPVSTLVNNARNKSVDCKKKVNIEKKKSSQTSISSWFTPKRKSSEDGEGNSKRPKL